MSCFLLNAEGRPVRDHPVIARLVREPDQAPLCLLCWPEPGIRQDSQLPSNALALNLMVCPLPSAIC